MVANYQLRKHLRAMEAAERPERVAWRIADNEAREIARRERREKFPVVREDNLTAVAEYQEARRQYHLARLLDQKK